MTTTTIMMIVVIIIIIVIIMNSRTVNSLLITRTHTINCLYSLYK